MINAVHCLNIHIQLCTDLVCGVSLFVEHCCYQTIQTTVVVVDFYYSDIPENLQIFTQNVEKGEKLTRRAIVGL